jgi:hypothetical protein
MYAIYGNINHPYTPNVSIYIPYMDPMGYVSALWWSRLTSILFSGGRSTTSWERQRIWHLLSWRPEKSWNANEWHLPDTCRMDMVQRWGGEVFFRLTPVGGQYLLNLLQGNWCLLPTKPPTGVPAGCINGILPVGLVTWPPIKKIFQSILPKPACYNRMYCV